MACLPAIGPDFQGGRKILEVGDPIEGDAEKLCVFVDGLLGAIGAREVPINEVNQFPWRALRNASK